MASKKIEEGQNHIKAAEKSLKTSFMKWRPDHDIAADEYQKAATCFRNAKSYGQCKDCLMKAAECHKQNRSWYHAAKCLDQAILVCKDMGDFSEIYALADRACTMFQQHGSPDSGAACLDKAAKLLESQHPEQALRLYQRAAEVVNIEDSPRQAAEFMSKVARILVKLKMYDQAVDALRRELGFHQQCDQIQAMGRLTVCLVLVQLARGDYVAAEKAYREWGNCCEAPENNTLERLLHAYDQEDAEAARSALDSPFIKHMDVEYSRLARDLPLPDSGLDSIKQPMRENPAPSSASGAGNSHASSDAEKFGAAASSAGAGAKSGIDDEYEGGLC